jgi:hypothetical protein
MPYSSNNGKEFFINEFVKLADQVWREKPVHNKNVYVLDIGVGAGIYADLITTELSQRQGVVKPDQVKIAGVEIYYPYVKNFDLNYKYDRLIIGDARHLDYSSFYPPFQSYFDFVILGDVVEHMTKEEALKLIDKIPTQYVILSIPISIYHQGEEFGNPFEAHVKPDWSHDEVIHAFGIGTSMQLVKFEKHEDVGVYIFLKGLR